jgi:ElaB/YqjD/DUF883 family membrane-anchored ribosome-binding protein
MNSKPKNFAQALDQLNQFAETTGENLKHKLEAELHSLEEKIQTLKPQLEDIKSRVKDEAGKAKEKVEEQVKENPWAAVGIVGLIFFVLGFLLAGRSRRND